MKALTTVLMAAVCITAAAQGAVYNGKLTGGGGGIYATDGWNSTLTAFTYTVTVPEGPGLVHYKYEWTVPSDSHGISHLIIEVSDDFTCEDIVPPMAPDTYSAETQGSSNPDMPSPMFGIKFDSDGGEFNWVIEFDSTRLPTWGDFYSKDGTDPASGHIPVYAFNDGFTIVDPPSDPKDPGYVPPNNTPYQNKILVPDTRIPEPATVALLGLGMLAGLMRKNIRRNLSLWIVAISLGAMALPASAGVKVLVDPISGETSGWQASWESGLDPYVDIAVDSVDSQAVVIQKFAEFNLFKPILITFTQTSASAVSFIVIEDEGITNSSGVDWTDFHFELLDGAGDVKDAVFVPAKTAASGGPGPIGWYIGPFEQAAFADSDTVLNVWDGVVADGGTWFPGDGAQDGQLWIDVNPKLERPFTTFTLKEIPTPEPASAALLGLGMLVGLARRRRLD